MCPELTLVGVHTHRHPQGSLCCEKPEKKLEKNLDPPIINPIIRENKKCSNFYCKIQYQMCPQLPLFSVHTHRHPQGSLWCEKPHKKLDKNLDPPIINPIIRENIKKFSNIWHRMKKNLV